MTLNPQLTRRLRKLRAFLLDVDGVLTDGSITVTSDGIQDKVIKVMDAESIQAAQAIGVQFGIITSSASDTVLKRAKELNITDIYQGSYDKADAYEEFKHTYEFTDEQVAYMGDGILDVSVLKQVGFAATPSDAHPSARMAAHFVSRHRGGYGAVREVLATRDPNLNVSATTFRGFTPGGESISRTTVFRYNGLGQVSEIDGARSDVSDRTFVNYYVCSSGGRCGQQCDLHSGPVNVAGHLSHHIQQRRHLQRCRVAWCDG